MSKKKKQLEAERKEAERQQALQRMEEEQRIAAAKEEEERRKNRPIAMEEYYNIAYAKERKRLNEMFGRIDYGYYPDEPTTVEKIITREPDKSKFVPVEKYKKKKKAVGFLTFTTLIFAAAAIFFALEAFNIINFF